MKPPCRDDSIPPAAGPAGKDSVVYVERNDKPGTWEDRQRCRSHYQSPQLLLGAFSLLVFWLSVPALLLCLVMLTKGRTQPWTALCLWSGGLMAVSLVSSLLVSMNVKCPLCHGPPLHSRHGCHKHRLARRWFPFTHRATVALSILTTLSFRCMYCGTAIRLRPGKQRRGSALE